VKNTAVRYHTGNCFYVLKKLSPHRMVMLLFSLAVYSFVTLLFFFLESPFSVLKFWYYWFYCRAVYYGCHISLEIVGRVTPKF